MAEDFDIGNITGKAREIAVNVDNKIVKDYKLTGIELSVFLAECKESGIEVEKEPWYVKCKSKIDEQLQSLKSYVSNHQVAQRDAVHNYKADVTPVDGVTKKQVNSASKAEDNANYSKEEICRKMCAKWNAKFKNTSLNQGFYEKLYDVIDVLHVKIPESKLDRKNYSSEKEQAMDEILAIFAGESRLNPACKKGIYNGLFQLATPGLIDAKLWAKKNPDVPGMKNISKGMTISKFRNSSGQLQLDYLVAYIGKCKEYSKIGKNESISPGQLWAMIKYPFKGRNKRLIEQKTDSISNVFKNSKVDQGIMHRVK